MTGSPDTGENTGDAWSEEEEERAMGDEIVSFFKFLEDFACFEAKRPVDIVGEVKIQTQQQQINQQIW